MRGHLCCKVVLKFVLLRTAVYRVVFVSSLVVLLTSRGPVTEEDTVVVVVVVDMWFRITVGFVGAVSAP